ncbi:MAG TPA: cytochrome c [Methylomirabilota bacterium]|nr:cytochrome c [Methylomirabilota bacterium]
MQQLKTQGAMARGLMAFILVTSSALGLAFGQTGPVMQAEIPYEFTVGSKVLPAGTYTFSVDNFGLGVQSATSGVFHAPIITRLGGPAEFLRDGSLVFDKTDGGRILSEIWIPGTDGILLHSTPKGHSRDVLLASNLDRNRSVSGREAYNLTCGRCHGPDGNGDARADKFFNITIPRLSSAEVQGKSDAELKEIITQGSRAMPPVEIDESGFRHRLPPQDVDAVIAYVRTLKR